MADAERNNITLVVYYRSTQPVSTLSLPLEDASLACLMDSLEVIPCGTYYCLHLLSAQEFRHARRILPAIGYSNRNLRFRGFLRKKALKRFNPVIPEAIPETNIPHSNLSARTAHGVTFRLNWIKSIY